MTSKHTLRIIAVTMLFVTLGLAPMARADAGGSFRSPTGDVECLIGTYDGGDDFVYCDISVAPEWIAPPRPMDCHGDWGNRFRLEAGKVAEFGCYGQELPAPTSTLGYGQQRSVGLITCDSEPSGMTCTDTSTGHFFRVSRESYQLGERT